MNTNVGDMPLDIFSDYISDILGEEWSWEYLTSILNWYSSSVRDNQGCGTIGHMPNHEDNAGDGYSYDYADDWNDALGVGSNTTLGILLQLGDGGQRGRGKGNGWMTEYLSGF